MDESPLLNICDYKLILDNIVLSILGFKKDLFFCRA